MSAKTKAFLATSAVWIVTFAILTWALSNKDWFPTGWSSFVFALALGGVAFAICTAINLYYGWPK